MSHFRSSTLTVDQTGLLSFTFTGQQSWRSSYPWGQPVTVGAILSDGTPLHFGDGTSTQIYLKVIAVNSTEDYFIADIVDASGNPIQHTYGAAGAFEAYLEWSARIATNDAFSQSSFRSETIVNAGTLNDAPVSSVPAIVQVGDNGIFTYQIPAFDPDGNTLNFRIGNASEFITSSSSSLTLVAPAGATLSSTGLLTWDVRDAGGANVAPGEKYTMTAMISDGLTSTPVDFILQIVDVASNQAPTFTSVPPTQNLGAGDSVSVAAVATDPNGNLSSIQVLNPPAGMATTYHAAHGELHIDFSPSTPGTYVVTIQAIDDEGLTTQTSVTFNVSSNTAPTLANPIADVHVTEDQPVSYQVPANSFDDPDGDALTYSATLAGGAPLPNWLTFDAATRTFSGTPPQNLTGTISLEVTASDGSDDTSDSFDIIIDPVDDAPDLDTSIAEATFVENSSALVVDPNVTLTDVDGPNMTGAVVAIASGYVAGQDSLGYTSMHGITGSFNAATGQLVLGGSATAAQYQAVLRTVTYANSSDAPGTGDRQIEFSASSASTLFYSGTGHYYQFISVPPASNLSWTQASTNASNSFLFGLQGYLTTITSAGEQAFVQSRLQGTGWMGANDVASEGSWRWVTGPEGLANGGTGTPFWTGGAAPGGAPVVGAFTNWSAPEPNNFGGVEDYGHFYPDGSWNDFPLVRPNEIAGYVVEYGGMPGDPAIDLTGSVTIHVQAVNDAPVPTATQTALAAIGEDNGNPAGQTVSALFGGLFSDVDAGSSLAGVAISANPATAAQGSWQYHNGAGWVTIGAVSEASALLLAPATLVRFVPAFNFTGAAPPLSAYLVDNSFGAVSAGATTNVSVNGGTSAFSDNPVLVQQQVDSAFTATARGYFTSGPSLINGLGGSAGFGETNFGRNDDFQFTIDLRPVFGPNGANLFGDNVTQITLSTNGWIAWYSASNNNYVYVGVHNFDVDTRGATSPVTTGGTSTGSNLLWVDEDAGNNVFTITWDDVGQWDQNTSNPEAFQLQLIGSASDRTVLLFRYENTDFAGYYGGPFISRSAGFAAGYPYHYALPTDQGLELVAPNVTAAQLDSTVGNTGAVGVWAVPSYAGVASTNQPPVSTTPNAQRNGDVVEAGNLDNGSPAPGQPNAAGQLSATDSDGGTISWSAATLAGRYGTFTLTPTGAWTYTLDNSRVDVDGLAEGETLTDTLAVLISDGQGGFGGDTVTITVNGANDAPVVTTAPGNDTGAVVEAGLAPDGSAFAGTPGAGGKLASSDVDNGSTATWSAATLSGTYGTFTLSPAGAWTYTLDNSRAATNALAVGQQVTDVLNATVTDDKGAVAAETVTVTVTGTNDRPDAVDDTLTGGAAIDVAVVTGDGTEGQRVRDGLVALGRFASVTVVTDTAAPALAGYEAVLSFSDSLYANPTALGNLFADYVDAGGRLALATYGLTTNWGIAGRITTAGYLPLVPVHAGSNPTGAIVAVLPDHPVFADVDLAALTGTFFYNSNYANAPLAGGATLLATDGNGLNMIAVNAVGTVYAANIFPGFEGAGETDFWELFANMLAPPSITEDAVTTILTSRLLANDSDADATDTLSVTAVSAISVRGATVTLNGGTISYDPRSALNHLAAGVVVEDSFTYTIVDNHGATDTATVRLNVAGVNDAPVIANVGTLAGAVVETGFDANGAFRASPPLIGKLYASDVDQGDVLSWNIVGGGDTPLGGVVIDQTGTWTYSLDFAASDRLALGQIVTETFTVRIADEHGGSDEQQVEITITGSNDRPTIVNGPTASAGIGEAGDGSAGENVVVHGTNGMTIYFDVDLSDTHSASFTALGANYLGTFSLGAVDNSLRQVGWSFSVSDSVLDTLAGGQTLAQDYLVTITDPNGGSASQVVTLYLVGSNDAAIVSADNVIVVQGASPVTVSGDLAIDDIDGPEAFQVQTGISGTHGSFSVDAEGRWSYQAYDNNADLLPGQSLVDFFVVKAADGTPTSVTVTIAGSDDAGSAKPDRFETDEATPIGSGLSLFADNGFGLDVDPDGSLSIAKINGVAFTPGQPIQLLSGALLTVNADGTFSYDPNDAFNALNRIPGSANQFDYDHFSYQLSDGSGASVLIRVNGVASPDDVIFGQATRNEFVNSTIFGTAGNDRFMLQPGGTDSAFGLDGNDGFYFGSALRSYHSVDGGAGTDTVALQGDYSGLLLGGGIVNAEVLLILSGSDARFGDAAGNSYDYDLKTVDTNVGAGRVLTVQAGGLRPGEDLVFDGSAETSGAFRIFAGRGVDQLTGGAGNDGFFFGADGNLTGADRIVGGAGIDSVALRGNYVGADAVVFQDASLVGVEVIVLLSGHTNEFGGAIVPGGYDYDLTLANGNVTAGQRLDIIATNLWADESVRVDGRAVSGGTLRILSGAGNDSLFGGVGADSIAGGLGADQIDGGAGADVYLYRSALESTAAARDTIAFTAGDRIDLSMIDAKAGTAVNDGFSFIGSAAFSGAAGELRAALQGGQWLVEGDVNGDGVADLLIAVTSAGPLAAGDFVL